MPADESVKQLTTSIGLGLNLAVHRKLQASISTRLRMQHLWEGQA